MTQNIVHEGTIEELLALAAISRSPDSERSHVQGFWEGLCGAAGSGAGMGIGLLGLCAAGLLAGGLSELIPSESLPRPVYFQLAVVSVVVLLALLLQIVWTVRVWWREMRCPRGLHGCLEEATEVLARLQPALEGRGTLTVVPPMDDEGWTWLLTLNDRPGGVWQLVVSGDGQHRLASLTLPGRERPQAQTWERLGFMRWHNMTRGTTPFLAAAIGDWVGAAIGAEIDGEAAASDMALVTAGRSSAPPEGSEAWRSVLVSPMSSAPLALVGRLKTRWRLLVGYLAYWVPVWLVGVFFGTIAAGFLTIASKKLSEPDAEIFDVMALYFPLCLLMGLAMAAIASRPASIKVRARRVRRSTGEVALSLEGGVLSLSTGSAVDLGRPFAVRLHKQPGGMLGIEIAQKGALDVAVVRLSARVQPSETLEGLPELSYAAPEVPSGILARLFGVLEWRAGLHGEPLRLSVRRL